MQFQHAFDIAGARPDLFKPVVHRVDQRPEAVAVSQQVFLQVGIAVDYPDITQHFEQHACGDAGITLMAQFVEQVPAGFAKITYHDLTVGE